MSAHSHSTQDRDSLKKALILTGSFMGIEILTGYLSNSLALLSDGFHMFGDVLSLSLNWASLWLASRPRTQRLSYGFVRAEILGGFISALGLWVSGGYIIYEGIRRLQNPQPITAPAVIAVSALGLIVNLIVLRILHRSLHSQHSHLHSHTEHSDSHEKQEGGKDSVNDHPHKNKPNTEFPTPAKRSLALRAAYLHVIADTLGSVGALASGVIYIITQWIWIDSIASFLIAALILFGSWHLLQESLSILMESSPSHIKPEAIEEALLTLPQVHEVHDLHIWSLNSAKLALSAHLVVKEPPNSSKLLREALTLLENKFGIHHITLQVESPPLSPTCYACESEVPLPS